MKMRRRTTLGTACAVLVLVASGLTLATSTRAAGPAARPIGDIRVFATIPYPGNPGGLAVDGHILYVDTSASNFDRPFDGSASVFAYNLGTGQPVHTARTPVVVPLEFPVQNMGLAGMALDAAGRLYIADMNGRIMRVDPRTGTQDVYARFPTATFTALNHMPTFLAFAADGNLYVGDAGGGAPIIWRIPPGGGTAQPWFVDPHMAGGWAGSVLGIAVDPTGQDLYFATGYQQPGMTIYRLPIAHPDAGHLQAFHQYTDLVVSPCPPSAEVPNCLVPQALGAGNIAFGRSGRLYVVLLSKNQLSILRPDGTEETRFPSPEVNARQPVPLSTPFDVTFNGQGSLLVSNGGDYSVGYGPGRATPPTNGFADPKTWVVFDIYVGDTGSPLARPVIP